MRQLKMMSPGPTPVRNGEIRELSGDEKQRVLREIRDFAAEAISRGSLTVTRAYFSWYEKLAHRVFVMGEHRYSVSVERVPDYYQLYALYCPSSLSISMGPITQRSPEHEEIPDCMRELPRNLRLLDLAAGDGSRVKGLVQMGVAAFGIDPYFAFLGDRQENLVPGLSMQLPFAGESFDRVQCVYGTFRWGMTRDQLLSLREAIRVTRRGGIIQVYPISLPRIFQPIGSMRIRKFTHRGQPGVELYR